jgi:hypothetical protein
MSISKTSSARSAACRTALIALGCALSLALVQTPALKAADPAAPQAPAVKAPSLPVTATFEKVAGAESGPYVLNLKNVSQDALKVSAKILLAVAFHMDSKARIVPAHVIDPGQVWSIADLAAGDRITLTAEGFSPLELTVPQGTPEPPR